MTCFMVVVMVVWSKLNQLFRIRISETSWATTSGSKIKRILDISLLLVDDSARLTCQ